MSLEKPATETIKSTQTQMIGEGKSTMLAACFLSDSWLLLDSHGEQAVICTGFAGPLDKLCTKVVDDAVLISLYISPDRLMITLQQHFLRGQLVLMHYLQNGKTLCCLQWKY